MTFTPDPDGVDPSTVPQHTLPSGLTVPGIGLGTFGSDRYGPAEVAAAVHGGLRVGYRFVDCAAVYGNEDSVGEVLDDALGGGLPREELFVVSKVWNDRHAPQDVVASCKQSLHDLRLDHLDAYLVHWPFPNFHRPFAHRDERNPDSRPYLHEEFMATWQAMESLVDAGLVRSIGTSNVTVPKLELILRDARIAPALNEMELHPTFQQGELFQMCKDNAILPIGFSPLGSPSRPERDRTPQDVADTEQPAVLEIARAHGVHPALVCLAWAVQRGQVPIPFAVKREQYLANLRAAADLRLGAAELDAMRGVESNCRLIKGQVFLWPGATGWLDLWDVDGTIPGWDGYAAP